jgi:hypothetical protein
MKSLLAITAATAMVIGSANALGQVTTHPGPSHSLFPTRRAGRMMCSLVF